MNQPSSTGDSALTTTRHKERACGRRRYERITAERIARGMCPRCGKARPAPDRTLCRHCGEKRRKAERARCAKAKAAGIPYCGRDAERCRAFARDRGRRRDRARRDARTCTRCGTHPPVEGGAVCVPYHVARRDREREQYATRRTAGLCGRCGTPAPSDAALCDRCARSTAKRSRKKAKNARSRQRYARRRARRLCSDCGAPSQGASRCRIEKRPPRLNLLAHPYLPRAEVATTSARSYMGLLKGAAP